MSLLKRSSQLLAGAAAALALAMLILPAGAAPSGSRLPEALLRKAESEGKVRVIIGLSSPARPEGDLAGRLEVQRQRASIAQARSDLLAALPAGAYADHHGYETIPFLAMEATPEALRLLDSLPGVRSIQEDLILRPLLSDSTLIVGADDAWAEGFTGAGWRVAILDTGVDKKHAFLSGKVVSEACYSFNASCPNGNKSQTGAGAGVPCGYAPSGCGHGTHVAGIAAGNSGVAKGASIISIQVFSRFTGIDCVFAPEEPCAGATISDVVKGLERIYALRDTHKIAAVNLSIGGLPYTSQQTCDQANPIARAAIDNLRSVGIATVAASGNDGYTNRLSVPACISSAISVGATSKQDVVPSWSNSAPFLSLLAPGESISSSIPRNSFATFSGTSMAAPHVTGAWAIRKQSAPSATVAQVLSDLIRSGDPILDTRNQLTKPRLDIGAALLTCSAQASLTQGDPPLTVDFMATLSGGTGTHTALWDFDDGSPAEAGQIVSHTFASPGRFQVSLEGEDANGVACFDTVAVAVNGPYITSVRAASAPFRLIVTGGSFEPGAVVVIDGTPVPTTSYKSPTRVVALKGLALKAMLPAGVTVQVTVTNPDGVTSAQFPFTR